MTSPPRVSPGGRRDLGLLNATLARIASRVVGVRDVHLFSVLGRTRGLFRGWLHYSGRLMPFGTLPRRQAELVILRVAALRESAYELDHHRRLGARAGLRAEEIAAATDPDGRWPWAEDDRVLLDTADALVRTRDVDDVTWEALAARFSPRALVEIVLLVCQYDGLATTLHTLRVPLDVSAGRAGAQSAGRLPL
ncbi:carboxymuconolactone decarboxylase family protein [Mumia sp. ZJ1417]|uniref:carboxymuconolactone decarboxylase family protein n=1 Tax=Mumia sp. ZJ1417 TaxID=2708082 RepID=UPI00141FDBC6|nr:carboxymuconolactone decarboxylase family protein [Mumia sp. ZJ1417]QMW65505.1 carboxymuconolactone decarboxylase family protein [Mumia sp. ZJ1417]